MLKEKTAVVCGAKDKANCRYHHPEKYAAQKHKQQVNQFFGLEPTPKSKKRVFSTNSTINQAFTSSLKWEGEQPVWWNEYEQTIGSHPTVPTTAQLVDVIKSPVGDLAVIWQQDSDNHGDIDLNSDSGYGIKVCYLKHVETGEEYAYLKMAHMNDETFARSFGDDEFTPFRYHDRYHGMGYGFTINPDNSYADRDLQGEELIQKRRQVWVSATKVLGYSVKDKNGEYVMSYNINENHLPDDETVVKDLKKYSKQISIEMNETRQRNTIPYVDFSRVQEPIKGQGIGTTLYVYTARMLATEGNVLRASGTQSYDAKAAWERFKTNFPNKIKVIETTYKGNTKSSFVLDFRK